jgi:hypothetical protein
MDRIPHICLVFILAVALMFTKNVNAADLIFVDDGTERDGIAEKVDMVCRFYGIDFRPVPADVFNNGFLRKEIDSRRSIGGIVINARTLPRLRFESTLEAIRLLGKSNHVPIPVLVTGVWQGMGVNLARIWSGGTIEDVENVEFLTGFQYKVAKIENLTFELSNLTFPVIEKGRVELGVFHVAPRKNGLPIIDVSERERGNETNRPVFMKSLVDGVEIYFHTGYRRVSEQVPTEDNAFREERFIELAPIFMFLRHSFGEKCWHAPHLYANLTIDDPWLIEPYGDMSYKALLSEMERSNFHTTIAFIPWNYDRGSADVVALFLKHPDRFSLSVHGNNHDHREFYGKSHAQEEENIRQALARMETMHRMTGLPFDRVMIFPHGIASARTLGLLKKYNFIATVNGQNIPLGSESPSDPIEEMRAVTLEYANFPSVLRMGIKDPATLPPASIAASLFLNGFILFYGHHDLFKDGGGAFDIVADTVNRIRPDIRWSSLGNFTRHLYYERLRDDGDMDVIAYSSEIQLENGMKRKAVYHVRKKESFTIPIREVLVDGRPYRSKIESNTIALTVEVPAGRSREIRIVYENDYDPSKVDVSKKGIRVYLLRTFSDFRDLVISQNVIGRKFVKGYYESGYFHYGMSGLAAFVFALVGVPVLGVVLLRKRRKARDEKKPTL